jgi:hypothetical protein
LNNVRNLYGVSFLQTSTELAEVQVRWDKGEGEYLIIRQIFLKDRNTTDIFTHTKIASAVKNAEYVGYVVVVYVCNIIRWLVSYIQQAN